MNRHRPIALVPFLVLAWSLFGAVEVCWTGDAIMSEAEKQQRIDSLYARDQRKFPTVEGITAEELIRALDAGNDLVLVDVRKSKEQKVSMIPGAIIQKEFEERSESLRGRTIITYCTAGYRSGQYAEKLQARGWQVRNLEGSLLSWTHAGGPLVNDQGPTRRVHVYSETWSLEAEGYDPVW